MIEPYGTWVDLHGPKCFEEAYGKCKKYVDLMSAAYPELKVCAGYYYCCIWGKRQHWWLEASNGVVIDPTAMQFPSKGTGEYEFLEEEKRPIGRCMNCGEDVFEGAPASCICSDRCEKETRAYMERDIAERSKA